MLIKLSSGYEINPERVDAIQEKVFLGMIEDQPLFGDARVCIAGEWFSVTMSELAKIRTFHTGTVLVEDSIQIPNDAPKPDCSGAQHGLNPKNKNEKTCSTCKHGSLEFDEGPCSNCWGISNKNPLWEPRS